MRPCEQVRSWIHPYVDGELEASKQLQFEAHLLDCEGCRAEYDAVRQVVDTVRGSKPLYPSDPALAAKVRDILDGNRPPHRRRTPLRVALMAGSFAATIALFAILPTLRSQRFTSFAANTHLSFAERSLPLGVSSDKPEVVSEWLQTYLPFHLSLPDFPSQPGEPKGYSLVGARLMEFDRQQVAYLAYTMEGRPISLLVSSSANIVPGSGETYTSGKLVFHFSSEKGLKLITWKDRGLSYALVSSLQVEGAQSCIVCHGSRPERLKFENLLRLDSPR